MTFLLATIATIVLLLTILVDGQDTGQAYWLPPASGDESAGGGGAAPASPGTSQYSVSPQAFYQGGAGAGAGGAAPPTSLLDINSGSATKLAHSLHLRHHHGPFQKEDPIDVDPAAMAGNIDDLTDEQLHLNHGSLTPTKLAAMKEEMKTLQKSLGTLMDKQTALQTQYTIEKEREVEDKALKKKVKTDVARSLLKHLDQQSKTRTDFMTNIVDQAISKVKDQYDLAIVHPDHPDTGVAGTGAEAGATGSASAAAASEESEESTESAPEKKQSEQEPEKQSDPQSDQDAEKKSPESDPEQTQTEQDPEKQQEVEKEQEI